MPMFRWVPYPFLRFTPALIAGILIGIHYTVDISVFWVAGASLIYGLAALVVPAGWRHRFSVVVGSNGVAGNRNGGADTH